MYAYSRAISWNSQKILLPLYKTLVRPHLEFCTAAWSPFYKKDKVLLGRVQHRFTRMMPGLIDRSYNDRLRILGLQRYLRCGRECQQCHLHIFFELDRGG